ncbi:MAG: hypothetical protein ACOH1I_01470 [Gallionellaceae bacterium]
MKTPQHEMLNKVPEVTLYFWIIKILCTTVGETASDFLNVSLGFGLTGTSIAMGMLLLVALFFQFKTKKYMPAIYWLTVVLISIFGTLATDNLTDSLGVPLQLTTAVFSIALMLTFIFWYAKEGTLSIHSIFTRRREIFYWLVILFTFALGTAAGDLMAEGLGLGYAMTGIIVCIVIAGAAIAWRLGLDAVLAFWIAYILTRPLGASLGDYLSQSHANGGLELGAPLTSAIFTIAIIAVVIFLTFTKRDFIANSKAMDKSEKKSPYVVWQTVVVVALLAVAAGSGYHWRVGQLQSQAILAAATTSPTAPLGDLSIFRQITVETLNIVRAGDLPAAKTRIGDLEFAWDNAAARLKPMNKDKWIEMDDAIDVALRNLRSARLDAAASKSSLEAMITLIDELDKRKH